MLRNSSDKVIAAALSAAFLFGGCQQVQNLTQPTVTPVSLRDVPAQRLGYRFEADILAPPELETPPAPPEKSAAVQADFDARRPQDALERTITAPDKQRVLAIYQNVLDDKGDYRMDLYNAGGGLVRKITPDGMVLRFPDSVVWSPDGANFAFAGARRLNAPASQEIVQEAPRPPELEGENQNANANTAAPAAASPLPAATTVLTFRTEQAYLANRDGGELRPLTQTEGLIYFYFGWSPDGSMLAAMACRENEWLALMKRAETGGEVFKPYGRPRLLEKNGRERRLDDNLSQVNPVWSPDSSKIAAAYETQVRLYDAGGNAPSSAALPLQVPLLLASKTCDDKIAANQSCVVTAPPDANANAAANMPTEQPATFLPIVALRWTDEKTIFLQTGYVKDFVEGESRRTWMRWHRLNLSPQAAIIR